MKNYNKTKYYDLSDYRNKGRFTGRAIADSNGIFVREISDFASISCLCIGANGKIESKKFYWMGSDNYEYVDPDERRFNGKLKWFIDTIDRIKKENPGKDELLSKFVRVTHTPKCFLMYMRVVDRPVGEKKFIFKHGLTSYLYSYLYSGFKDDLQAAIKETTPPGMDEYEWEKLCFSRDMKGSRHALSIDVSKEEITIGECANEIRLFPEDMDITRDLTKELISTVFDEERINEEIATMSKIMDRIFEIPGLNTRFLGDDIPPELSANIPPAPSTNTPPAPKRPPIGKPDLSEGDFELPPLTPGDFVSFPGDNTPPRPHTLDAECKEISDGAGLPTSPKEVDARDSDTSVSTEKQPLEKPQEEKVSENKCPSVPRPKWLEEVEDNRVKEFYDYIDARWRDNHS